MGRVSHFPVSFSLSKIISSPSSPIYAPRSSKLTAGAQAQVCFNRDNLIQSHILNLGISNRCFFREIMNFVIGFHKRKKKRRKEAQKQHEESLRRKRIEARKKVKKSERVALCLIQGDQQGSRHLRRRLWLCHSVVKQV
ncbi:uncharacterized protein LOC106392339 isoform X5 [Brassica napus]|uniref:uncharacterized protein LOC106392339 isoform X5 n=1 Tax=Brassica napus TaxID=3708 RepID=UPI000BBEB2C2|nr:uncharacterized protein LOC106392339 isoform X5 [Brassica napus]